MSLDLYIISKELIPHKGTGIFDRRNGQNVELSLEEAQKMYPEWDIKEVIWDWDDIYWHNNITHNLTTMADKVQVNRRFTLYNLLWRPEETDLLGKEMHPNKRYINLLSKGYDKLLHDPTLSVYNPENGWGDYNLLVKFTEGYIDALNSIKDFSNYTIEADR